MDADRFVRSFVRYDDTPLHRIMRSYWKLYAVFAFDTISFAGIYLFFDLYLEAIPEVLAAVCVFGMLTSFAWGYLNRTSSYWQVYRRQYREWKASPSESAGGMKIPVLPSPMMYLKLGLEIPPAIIAISFADTTLLIWLIVLLANVTETLGYGFPAFYAMIGISSLLTVVAVNWLNARLMRGALKRE